MVDVRFELTTNDPWSVDDAICEGISPLGYWQKVNQSPTQTKPYNISPHSPASSVDPGFVEIGLVQLSQLSISKKHECYTYMHNCGAWCLSSAKRFVFMVTCN